MRTPLAPRHRAWALLALAWAAGGDAPARADETSTDPSARESHWWIAGGLEGGIFVHRFDARVSSSDIANPPIDNPQPIRPGDSGAANYVAPRVDGSLELMGPSLGRIRPFIAGSLGGEFGVEKDVAKEGTVGVFSVPPNFPGNTPQTADLEALIRGQGSRVRLETANLTATAAAGVAVALKARGRTFRVKPALRYLWERIEVEGLVQRAVLLEPAAGGNFPSGLEDYRLIGLRAEETEAFHALGPGLEIEMDLSRRGRFVASVFVEAAAYFFLGDREIDLRASNAGGEFADFRVERQPVSYGGGVGLRVRFEPR